MNVLDDLFPDHVAIEEIQYQPTFLDNIHGAGLRADIDRLQRVFNSPAKGEVVRVHIAELDKVIVPFIENDHLIDGIETYISSSECIIGHCHEIACTYVAIDRAASKLLDCFKASKPFSPEWKNFEAQSDSISEYTSASSTDQWSLYGQYSYQYFSVSPTEKRSWHQARLSLYVLYNKMFSTNEWELDVDGDFFSDVIEPLIEAHGVVANAKSICENFEAVYGQGCLADVITFYEADIENVIFQIRDLAKFIESLRSNSSYARQVGGIGVINQLLLQIWESDGLRTMMERRLGVPSMSREDTAKFLEQAA